MPISITDAQFRQAATEKFERAKALKQHALLTEVAKLSRTTLVNGAYTMNDAAISGIFTEAVRAEEAADTKAVVAEDTLLDAAKVRCDALKTLHDLMTDDRVALTSRADIAKFIIESRRIG